MKCCVLVLLALLATAPLSNDTTRFPIFEQQNHDLKIEVQPTKPLYELGEPVELRVTLINAGNATLFVGQAIRRVDWLYSIKIRLLDEQGRSSPELHWSHPFMPDYDASQPFIDALARSWVPLPSGYSYGTVITLNQSDFEFLKKAGHYRIEASYVSLGMEEPLNYNRLAASPEEIKKLPYPSWRGETTAEPVSITVQAKQPK